MKFYDCVTAPSPRRVCIFLAEKGRRSLGHLLRSAGVESMQMKVHVDVPQIGSYRRTQLVQNLVIASGRITEAELKRHMTAVSEHLADPRTTLIDKLIVQAWGQKAN